MKQAVKSGLCVLLSAALLLPGLPARAAEEPVQDELGEEYSALTPEVARLAPTAGALYQPFSSTIYDYDMTLGPDETGFSLIASPSETVYPPTLTLYLDGETEPFDTLTPGEPSRFIEVAPGEVRTVLLRSVSYTDAREKEYAVTVHRTETAFQWSLGAVKTLADGTQTVCADLTAPAGLRMKSLLFSLGYDPARLRLCDDAGQETTELWDSVQAPEDFFYDYASKTGYFDIGVQSVDNAGGVLEAQLGGGTTALTKDGWYEVDGTVRGILSLNFKVVDGVPDESALYIPRDGSPDGGLAVVEELGGAFITSQCPGMVSVGAATPAPEPERPALPESGSVAQAAPYAGSEYLLAVNGQYSGSALFGGSLGTASVEEASGEPAREVDRFGNTVLDFTDVPAPSAQNNARAADAPAKQYAVGETAAWQTLAPAGGVWSARSFTLARQGETVNLWFENGNPMQVSDKQFDELLASFENSRAALESRFRPVYDRDGNGRLDVLLYDITDNFAGTGSYYAGFVSGSELLGGVGRYGSAGNNADVVHLDTYPAMGRNPSAPELSNVVSTMAHETQHLSMYSSFVDEAKAGKDIAPLLPPTWVNEGLSVAVEHERFGPRSSRMSTYNTSAAIRNGYSLTEWGGRVEDYALSYLFLEYLDAQARDAGITDLFERFYTSYGAGAEKTVLSVIQTIPQLADMDFSEVAACFYTALLLQEDTGVYGFCGQDAFRAVKPQLAAGLPSSLPAASAVYVSLEGADFVPEPSEGARYLGLTPAELTLTATADAGGTVTANPAKAAYEKGETVTVTADPEAGYVFSGWSGDLGGAAAGDRTITLTMDRAREVHAAFTAEPPEPPEKPAVIAPDALLGSGTVVSEDGLSATCSDEGGIVTLTAADGGAVDSLVPGTAIVLTAQPAAGMAFAGWKVDAASPALLGAGIEADATLVLQNPWHTEARANMAVSARYEAVSASAPELGVLEVSAPAGRRLVHAQSFGFDKAVRDYAVYLLPDELAVCLHLATEQDVSALTLTGADGAAVALTARETNGALVWTEDGADAALTLDATKTEGTVRLTLANNEGETAEYRVSLRRVEAPTATVSQSGANVTLTVQNAALRTVSVALATEKPLPDDLQTVIENQLVDTLLTLSGFEQKPGELRLVLEPRDNGKVLEESVTVPLFAGEAADFTILPDSPDNSISDARFGALYGTTQLVSGYEVCGTVRAQGTQAMKVTVYPKVDGVYAETGTEYPVAAPEDGTDVWTYTIPLAGGTYRLVFSMERHVRCTIEGVTVTDAAVELANVPYLPYGDLDGDGATGLADRNLLVSALYGNGNAAAFDLEGDGKTTLADLNLLMQEKNYNKRPQTVAAELKGV